MYLHRYKCSRYALTGGSYSNHRKKMNTITCTRCGDVKPATTEFFHVKKDNKYGLRLLCKPCKKEIDRERYEQNREKMRMMNKEWVAQNRDRIRDYNNKRYHEDPNVRMTKILRRRIHSALQDTQACKSSSSMDLLGCTIEECRKHLEGQFQEGMTWDNYGNPNGDHTECWHIDHIRPCSSFDLTDSEQQKECFHYTNLQPLWAAENLSKGARYDETV